MESGAPDYVVLTLIDMPHAQCPILCEQKNQSLNQVHQMKLKVNDKLM